jgi:hypothetical protein
MPSSSGYKRNYSQEYKTTHSSAKAKKERAKRNAARKKMGSPAGKDIDHKKGVAAGNSKANLRTRTVRANRAAGGKKGNKAGKAAGGRKGMAKRWGKKSK